MLVTIISNKSSGYISGLDVSIVCFCTINATCDSHYLKLLGTPHHKRYFGPVDQMRVDILRVDVMGVDILGVDVWP